MTTKTILKISKNINNVEMIIRMTLENKTKKICVIFNNKVKPTKVELEIDSKIEYLYDYNNHPYYYIESADNKDKRKKEMYPIEICEKKQMIKLCNTFFSPMLPINYVSKFYNNDRLYVCEDGCDFKSIIFNGGKNDLYKKMENTIVDIEIVKPCYTCNDLLILHIKSGSFYKCTNFRIEFYKEILTFFIKLKDNTWKMCINYSSRMKKEKYIPINDYVLNMMFDRKMTATEFFKDKFYYHDYFQKCVIYFILCLKKKINRYYIPPKFLLLKIVELSY